MDECVSREFKTKFKFVWKSAERFSNGHGVLAAKIQFKAQTAC